MNLKSYLPLLISVLIFGGAVGLYAVGYLYLTSLTGKAEELGNQIASKEVELAHAVRAQEQLASLATDEAAINQYSIGREDIPTFLGALEAGGRSLNTNLNVLSVSDEKGAAGHPRISLSLSIAGSFDAVMRTLGAIENSPYDGVVESVTLDGTGLDAKSGAHTWTAAVIYSVAVRATTTPSKP